MVPAATTEEQSPRRNDLSHASLFGSFLHLYADISFAASLLFRLYGHTNIHSVLCLSSPSNNGVRVLEFNSVKVDVRLGGSSVRAHRRITRMIPFASN